MTYVTIKAFDSADMETIDLVAKVDKAGNILKVSDHKGNERTVNLDGTVTFNKTCWQLPAKVDLK